MKYFFITLTIGVIVSYLGWWWGIWLGGMAAGLAHSDREYWKETIWVGLAGAFTWGAWSIYLYTQGGQTIAEKMAITLDLGSPAIVLTASCILSMLLALLGWAAGKAVKA